MLTIISWELFNKSLYLLVSLKSASESGLAASLKYFLLSALSTTFLLKGVALIYYSTGSTNYEVIETIIRELNRDELQAEQLKLIQVGKQLIVFTLLFKLSAAPFYAWSPDLLNALESKVGMWMKTMPKLATLYFLFLLTTSSSLFFYSTELILLITGS